MQTLEITKKQDYVIVRLNRPKANAINGRMVKEIRETFRALEEEESVRGVILTGIPHFFSAGLDVIELYQYDERQIKEFFIAFGSMHIELARFTKPFVCAISGHSPAGGTVIALTADYRIMADGEKYTIGLNEVAVNIQISQNLVEAYAYWIGRGRANQYVLDGKLLNVTEAMQCGLVNEAAPLETVLDRAEQKMRHYLRAHPEIFRNTKSKLRKAWLERIESNAEKDLEQAFQLWWKPEIRARMKAFVDSLSKNKKVRD